MVRRISLGVTHSGVLGGIASARGTRGDFLMLFVALSSMGAPAMVHQFSRLLK